MKSIGVLLGLLQWGAVGAAVAQSIVPDRVRAEVEAAVLEALDAEQAAFGSGDCDLAMSFFADSDPLFVVSGRTMNRPQLVRVCRGFAGPRGGPQRTLEGHVVHVLSVTAAYSVTHYATERVLPDGSRAAATQVVTKIWVHADDRWRIVHVHESVGGS